MRDQAFRVAVLGALKDRIATEYAEQRTALLGQLLDAQADLGVKSLDVSLPNGTKVATITLTEPSVRVTVDDEDAFTAWVARRYPTEVQTVMTVRPAGRKAILDQAVVEGEDVFDWNDGEKLDGVRAAHPAPQSRSFSVRYPDGGRDAIAHAWRVGELGFAPSELVQLEGGS
jgi:hypothetical protein